MEFKTILKKMKIENYDVQIDTTFYMPKNDDVDINFDSIDDACLIGSDYSSIIACTNIETVETFLNILSENSFKTLKNEIDYLYIPVFNINNSYIINIEPDYLSKEENDFINQNFISFGAIIDDLSILDCLEAFKYIKNEKISIEALSKKYYDGFFDIDEDKNSEEVRFLEELESSVDSIIVIFEYLNNKKIGYDFLDDVVGFFTKLYDLID